MQCTVHVLTTVHARTHTVVIVMQNTCTHVHVLSCQNVIACLITTSLSLMIIIIVGVAKTIHMTTVTMTTTLAWAMVLWT